VTGGTYFVTVNLAERNRALLVDQVDTLREVVQEVKAKHRVHIDAMIILPVTGQRLRLPDSVDVDQSRLSRRMTKGERNSKSRMTKVNAAFGNAAIGST
jgi:putative transposase